MRGLSFSPTATTERRKPDEATIPNAHTWAGRVASRQVPGWLARGQRPGPPFPRALARKGDTSVVKQK
jgi:hypothetical protein